MSRRISKVKDIACSLGYKKWAVYPSDVQELLKEEYAQGADTCEFAMIVEGVNPRHKLQKYKIDFNELTQVNAYSGKPRKIRLIKFGEDIAGEHFQKMDGRLADTSSIQVAVKEARKSIVQVKDDKDDDDDLWDINSDQVTRSVASSPEEIDLFVDAHDKMAQMRPNDVRKVVCGLGYKKWAEYPPDVQEYVKEEYVRGADECDVAILIDGANPRHRLQKYKIDFNNLTQTNVYSKKARKIKLIKYGEVVEGEDKFDVIKGKLADATSIKAAVQDARETVASKSVTSKEDLFVDNDMHQTDEREWESEEIQRRRGEDDWDAQETERRQREDREAEDRARLETKRLELLSTQTKPKEVVGMNTLLKFASESEYTPRTETDELRKRIEMRKQKENKRLMLLQRDGQPKDAKYQLIYNNAGRSEALRLLLLYTGECFEEKYIQGRHYKDGILYGALTLDRTHFLSRSNFAMLRYLGVVHNLYPKDAKLQSEVDELIAELRDFATKFFNLGDQTKCDRLLAKHFMPYERQIAATQGSWLFKDLTVADFELVALTKTLNADKFVDASMFAEAFPKIMEMLNKISSNDAIYVYDRTRRRVFQSKKKTPAGDSSPQY